MYKLKIIAYNNSLDEKTGCGYQYVIFMYYISWFYSLYSTISECIIINMYCCLFDVFNSINYFTWSYYYITYSVYNYSIYQKKNQNTITEKQKLNHYLNYLKSRQDISKKYSYAFFIYSISCTFCSLKY